MLILWAHAEFPPSDPALVNLPGRRVTIDDRPAKLYSGRATDACPAHTDTEVDAFIRASGPNYPGERIDMRACLGANVTQADRSRVTAMLYSLRIRTHL